MDTHKVENKARLSFKEVASIPHLKMAEGLKARSGTRLVAFSWHEDSVHIAADSSIRGFGGITVIGPGVTTAKLDWGKLIDFAIDLGMKILGGDDGGGGGGHGQTCTMTSTVTTDAKGNVTSMNAGMNCKPS
jgi:hypothetical protein